MAEYDPLDAEVLGMAPAEWECEVLEGILPDLLS
jgi:hypothetical protein